MANIRALTLQGGKLQQLGDADSLIVGAGIATASGSILLSPAGTERLRVASGGVGISTGADPHASAALEIGGTTKGFLLPRLTTSQRDQIASPAEGLLAYNSTTKTLQEYVGGRWTNVFEANVQHYGAKGDGVTDDYTPVNNAIAAVKAAGGGVVYFPPGTYLINTSAWFITGTRNGVTLRGAGPNASVIKRGTSGATQTFHIEEAATRTIFENLTFDGGNVSNSFCLLAKGEVLVRRCHFRGIDAGYGVYTQSISNLLIDDCLFESDFSTGVSGNSRVPHGVWLQDGFHNVQITRSRFRYMYDAIFGVTGTSRAGSQLVVEGCYFDMGWYTLPAKVVSGKTYAGTPADLTETTIVFSSSADVGTFNQYDNIRLNRKLRAGTISSATNTSFLSTADGGSFVTAGVQESDIVKTSDGRFAIVSKDPVASAADRLCVEEWLDNVTRLPTTAPAANATYTVYHPIMGRHNATEVDGVTVTVQWWHDLYGNRYDTATLRGYLSGGTIDYEILPRRPNYQIHVEDFNGAQRVVNNTVLRGWSDQVSLYGADCVVAINTIGWGEDYGVTLNGERCTVVGNHISYQGSGPIYGQGGGTITGNVLIGHSTQNNTHNYAACLVLGGDTAPVNGLAPSRWLVTGNWIDTGRCVTSRYGVVLSTGAHTSVVNNVFRGQWLSAPIHVYGSGQGYVGHNDYADFTGTPVIKTLSTVSGGGEQRVLLNASGAGAPPSDLFGAAGSTWTDKTSGEIYYYTGSAWKIQRSIDDASVTTAKLADDAVTAAKLADDAVTDANRAVTTNHVRDAAITTAKVADAAVTEAKLATSVAGAGLTGGAGSALAVGEGHGLQVDADAVTVKLDGGSLTKSATGLKATFGTTTGTVLEGSNDALYVKLAGAQDVSGQKTFQAGLIVSTGQTVAGAAELSLVATGANHAAISTNGGERLRVGSDGGVLIGTTTALADVGLGLPNAKYVQGLTTAAAWRNLIGLNGSNQVALGHSGSVDMTLQAGSLYANVLSHAYFISNGTYHAKLSANGILVLGQGALEAGQAVGNGTIRPPNQSGLDKVGTDITIGGGAGTGAGTPGRVIISTTTAEASSSTVQATRTERLVVGQGVGVGTTTDPGAGKLRVATGVGIGTTPSVGLHNASGEAKAFSVITGAYTATSSDHAIAVDPAASFTVTLPSAAAVPAGFMLRVLDVYGKCSASVQVTIARAGTDTISGNTSEIISSAYGAVTLICDGVSRWTVLSRLATA